MKTLLLLALGLAVISQPTPAPAQSGGTGPARAGGGGRRCAGPGPTKREDDGKVYRGSEVTCKAMILARPEPEFPPGARSRDVQGSVLLRAVLLASGKVGEVTIVRGAPHGVSEAAVEAARRIKFRPAVRGDHWVSQRILLEYNFNTY